ncbi:hypothetical protein E1890_16975 [Salmonella enterica subsp. enterica serovar Mountpleasant]|nr:hypothetical protein [Salmonella enterica subsp. enterica serovar Mountpleasant]
MANETILDVLKVKGKTSVNVIAEILKIECIDVINELQEMKNLGEVQFKNGGWSLPGYKDPKSTQKNKSNKKPEVLEGVNSFAQSDVQHSQPQDQQKYELHTSQTTDTKDNNKPENITASVRGIVESIPSFTENPSEDLLIPSPTEMARMIRKAKCNLRELEQIRRISIAAKKHSKTLTRMAELKREE